MIAFPRDGMYRSSGRLRPALLALLLSLGLVSALAAQEESPPAHELTLGLSFHDVSGRLGTAAAVEIGYRPAWRLFKAIRPDAGAMAGWDGALYAYVGIFAPIRLPSGMTLDPSLGVGGFGAGDQTDLGSALEFRSGISVGIPLSTRHPLELSFYHLSNAGLRRPNPGMEVVSMSYLVSW
jgi:hypothetical protein